MTGRLRKKVAVLAIAALGVTLFGGTSLAYFTAVGAGNAASAVSTLADPALTTATAATGGTVTLAWGAVTSPDGAAVTYSVTRDGEAAAGTCAPLESPTPAVGCVDKSVEPGTHVYAITAHWRSWTSESNAKSATVIIGGATHFTITATTTTLVVGAADNLTITARDVNEAVVTTYAGGKSLIFSGASASPSGTAANIISSSNTTVSFGVATPITFTNGVAAVASSKNGVMKIYRAGSAAISATDGTISASDPLAVTVSPGALNKFVLKAETPTPVVGAADDLTIAAQDQYGNTVTSHAGLKNMAFAGGTTSPAGNAATVTDSSGASIPFATTTSILFEDGVATTSGAANGEMRLYKTGAQLIKVQEGSVVSAQISISPNAGSAVKFSLTGTPTSTTAGVSINTTTTAQDEFGNTATSYTGAKSLVYSGAAASPSGTQPTVAPSGTTTGVAFGTATSITFTNGVAAAASSKNGTVKIYRVGSSSLTVTDGTITNPTPLAVTISPGTLNKFVLAAETTAPVAGAADDLTITAQDSYGNVNTGFEARKSLIFSGATASPAGNVATVTDADGNVVNFGTATPILFETGVATTSGAANGEMRLYKTAAQTIKVAEGTIAGTQVSTPTPATAAKLALNSSVSTFAAGSSSNLTTVAQDAYGNIATSYAGSKSIIFSGAGASPAGTVPTVINTGGVAIPFGGGTELNFIAGAATVTASKNGLLRLYRSGATSITADDGSLAVSAPATITVTTTTAGRLAFTNVASSAGVVGSPCFFTCAITSLGNSGTVKGDVVVTDAYGNTNSNIGIGHSGAVTVVSGGGAITSGTFAFPSTGPAESPAEFTYTAPASGAFTASLKAAPTVGTAYTNATATATK